jgi:hypothetical protein
MALDKKDMSEILNYILPEIKEYIDKRSMKVGQAVYKKITENIEKKILTEKVLQDDGKDLSEMFEPFFKDGKFSQKPISKASAFNSMIKQKAAQGRVLAFDEIKESVKANSDDAIDALEHVDYSKFVDQVDAHEKGRTV